MSKASFVSLLVWELRLAKNFPIDLTDPVVMALLAAGGPLLWLPTAQAGYGNISNLSQRELGGCYQRDGSPCTVLTESM